MGNTVSGGSQLDNRTSLTRSYHIANHAPRAERAAVRSLLQRQEPENVNIKKPLKHPFKHTKNLEKHEATVSEPPQEVEVEPPIEKPVRKKLFDRSEAALQRELREHSVFVLSFNLLADKYVSNPRTPDLYKHCKAPYLAWPYRVKKILQHIGQVDADIVCLQEVGSVEYETDLEPVLKARGYVGFYNYDLIRKGTKDEMEIPGQATFAKRSVFDVAWTLPSFRAAIMGLSFREKGHPHFGKIVAVANVHLEGAPHKHQDRENQFKAVNNKIAKKKCDYTIACGDFNTSLDDDPCSKVVEKLGYLDAYRGVQDTDPTCILKPWKSLDKAAVQIDHILYKHNSAELQAIMRIIDSDWNRTNVLKRGLPSKKWPSDHLSIGAILNFTESEARSTKPSKSSTTAKSAAVDVNDALEQATKALEDALSPEEYEKFLSLEDPPKKRKVPLTKEEIGRRIKRSEERREFLSTLTETQRREVKKYTTARKKAFKALNKS